jgi:transposase InsO family protein
MIKWLSIFVGTLLSALQVRRELAMENLVLRQQLAVYKQGKQRPQLTDTDRRFWVVIASIWSRWRTALNIVQPETVIRWHRIGFRWFWARKCVKHGRPPIDPRIKALIHQMCTANPLWGAPRIHGELLKLGIDVSEATVSRYMIRRPKPPSQTWRTFLENHSRELLALDFFTVPTANFRVLFVLVILSHERREILHTNVTDDPNERWIAQQTLEVVGTDDFFRFLIRDCDVKYGEYFVRRVSSAGLRHVVTAPGSPWQNAYAERIIGTIRRECTDHTIVLSERHLRRVVRRYADYYNRVRTHLALAKDAPARRVVQLPDQGSIRYRRHCGGLHHEYYRQAA